MEKERRKRKATVEYSEKFKSEADCVLVMR